MSAMSHQPGRGTVVVIDDTEDIREEITAILHFERFDVHAAANGRDGLELIERVNPDAVLCDVTMPGLDGFATLAALRRDPKWNVLQFIFLTARAERDAIRRAMELGADDYLTKPFTAGELIGAVEAAIQKRRRIERESESRADQIRTQLSAALPHELRTPLHVVLGYAEILADGARELPPDEIEALAGKLLAGARQLSRTTENLLLSAQLDILEAQSSAAGLGTARPCRHRIVEAATAAANGHGRAGDLEIDADAELEAAIDETSLHRLVFELVDNACKFSAPGTAIAVIGRQGPASLQLLIRDAGIGMTAEQIGRIGTYTQFERDRREQAGLGLGLALATRLARLHGGSTTVASNTEGAGVSVTIELPAPGRDEPAQNAKEMVHGHGLA